MLALATANLALSLGVWQLAMRNSVNQCVHWFTGIKVVISLLGLMYGIISI